MTPFETLLGNLNTLGFYNFIFPWLFTLAVVYGILIKTEIFKDKSLNALISVVVAFFFVNYTPVGIGLDEFFTTLFGNAVLILAILVVVLLLMGLLGLKASDIFSPDKIKTGGMGAVLLILFVVLLLLMMGGFGISTDVIVTMMILILMLSAVIFIGKGE